MLHVFTHGNDVAKFGILKESAALCNLSINYITPSTWNGYYDKLKYLKEEIRNIPDDDIICFVDGYDVLAFANADEIVTKFKEFDCPFVMSAETNCYPAWYEINHAPPPASVNTIYRFVNSGGYVAYKRALWDLLTWKPEEEIEKTSNEGGDGLYFMKYFTEKSKDGLVKLDYEQKIFQTMWAVSWYDFHIQDGRVRNIVLGHSPCFFHFNGGSHYINNEHDSMLPIVLEKTRQSHEKEGIFTLEKYKCKIIWITKWKRQLV
jgi:hypothetical protein